MKRSEKFWIFVATLGIILYNIFWYNYELKYVNDPCTMCPESSYTCAVGLFAVPIDFTFVAIFLSYAIPKFNKWLDSL